MNPDDYEIKENYDSLGTALVIDGNGTYKGFDKDFKNIEEQGKVKNGKRDSIWKGLRSFSHVNNVRFNDGISRVNLKMTYINYTENYKNGILINGTSRDSTDKIYPYKLKEIMPQFKGGLDAFYKYLSNSVRYPDIDRKNNIQGRVIVTFIVDADGTIEDAKVIRGVSETLNEVALNVIKNCPKWLPGMQYGIPVRVQYTVPISFSLAR